ncbi:MAG: hypothetical protein U0K19_05265 [Bifidobacteriaceae bacterium]|nr:hypothetical protein [Bifidobacteriaceae bacterium]
MSRIRAGRHQTGIDAAPWRCDVIVGCASIAGASPEHDLTSLRKTEFNGSDPIASDIARLLKKEPVTPMVLCVSCASVYSSMNVRRRVQEI